MNSPSVNGENSRGKVQNVRGDNSDGYRRRESQVLEKEKEDEQEPGHQKVEMRFQQVLRIGKTSLDEPR